jgi:hypothetical protein
VKAEEVILVVLVITLDGAIKLYRTWQMQELLFMKAVKVLLAVLLAQRAPSKTGKNMLSKEEV